MENFKKKALNLLIDLAMTESKSPAVIPYRPQKHKISKKENPTLPRRIGGENRKYALPLLNLLTELESEKRANIHSILVYKDNSVILEASAPGYDIGYFHLAHSMSKTVVGLTLGFLYDEGKIALDDRVADFFPNLEIDKTKYACLTVEDLLTMRSGSGFAELGTVTEENWTEAFFEAKPTAKIGQEFAYNSINSYILGRIITKITGESLYKFAEKRLFAPLGITNHLWEMGSEDFTKGGFGLYLSAESFAKLGALVISRGEFLGKRILSEKYVSLMCKRYADAPDSIGGFDYGLHVWVSPDSEEILFNGMLGQNVWIYPKANILAVVNAGNNELFSDSPTLAIIRKNLKLDNGEYSAERADFKKLQDKIKHFFSTRRNIVTKEEKRGLLYFLGLKKRRPFDDAFTPLLGKYATRSNNAGILPLFVSIMQNNYQGGIEYAEFKRIGDELVMAFTEGGVTRDIPIGIYDYKEAVIDFCAEKYIVHSAAEVIRDENGNYIYRIAIIFPELPNIRILKITQTDEGILINMQETPDEKIAESYLENFSKSGKGGFIFNLIEKKMGEGFIKTKLHALFNPSLPAIDVTKPDYKEIIEADNKIIAAKNESSAKLLKLLASKFLSEEKSEAKDEEKKQSSVGSFLKNALSLLLKVAKVKPEEPEGDDVIEIPDETITFLDSSETEDKTTDNEDN